MANGYCPALLRHINDIAEGNAAANKMHVAGFLAMTFCCQNSSVSPINDGNQSNGQKKTLTVQYRKRPTEADVDSVDNCEINRIPQKLEWTIPSLSFKKTSWFLSDEEIKKYCDESAALRSSGARDGVVPAIMQEHYELLLEHANVLMASINTALVTSAATQFGTNVTTGTATGKVINVARDGNQVILDNGIVDMLRDFQENELCGDPCVVGGGLYSAWNINQQAACCNAAGVDMSKIGIPKFFFDKKTQAIWGQNTIGVFTKGSVKFLGMNEYVGPYAGQKGNSFFTTIPMPVSAFQCNADDCLRDLVFDLQMRYIDCPTDIEVNNVVTTVNRGWQFILSKRFALWVQPTNAYPVGDELENTNGTLKYFISNNTGGGKSYGYRNY
jgi:hypothetical protein